MSIKLASSLVLASTLIACGGGSTTTSDAPIAPVPAAPAPVAPPSLGSTLIPYAGPITSAFLSTEEKAAFDYLNTERSRCGFGVLMENQALNAATRAHANYLITNDVFSHYEVAGKPEFTGVTPYERGLYQNYANKQVFAYGEVITGVMGLSNQAGYGVQSVARLLNAPYHTRVFMAGFREMGASIRTNLSTGSPMGFMVAEYNLGSDSSDGFQLMGPTDVSTYPCAGSVGIDRQLLNETPNPVPGRDLASNPIGSSVYIKVRDGQVLNVTSANMYNASTGQAVFLRPTITASNDPHGTGYFSDSEAYVAPDAPLLAMTAYTVMITGTNNGLPFSRNFGFTTGP